MKSCGNCKHRMFWCWGEYECCGDYEMCAGEEDERRAAKDCPKYEQGIPECWEEEPPRSASAGDFSPSAPWLAPGMSISDFI